MTDTKRPAPADETPVPEDPTRDEAIAIELPVEEGDANAQPV